MRRYLTMLLTICMVMVCVAVPVNRTPFTHIQADGSFVVIYPQGDEYYHFYINANNEQVIQNEQGDWVVASQQLGRLALQVRHRQGVQRRACQEFGKDPFLAPHGLVILVQFSDLQFTSNTPQADFDSLMNGQNYTYDGATGSVRQYFIDQSDGQYAPQFSVVGPVNLPHPYAYYGTNDDSGYDRYLADVVIDACLGAKDLADFSQIDYDNDGYADFVYIIYAGQGEADGGKSDALWPCSWELSNTLSSGYTNQSKYTSTNLPKINNKLIENYAISNELQRNGKRTGIGTICHEYSHVCGLPDIYDTYYGSNYTSHITPNKWHLMDYGLYNNNGKTPPSLSPWDKYFLGWVTPTLLATACHDTLPADGVTYRYFSSDGQPQTATSATPIYYLENRQQTDWDTYAPGHGLLVWMVNYNGGIWAANEPNASPSDEYGIPEYNQSGELHYQLISANGMGIVASNQSDPFPGTNQVHSYSPLAAYPMTDISESNGLITFKFMGGDNPPASLPTFVMSDKIVFYDMQGRYCGSDITQLKQGIYIQIGKIEKQTILIL